ncbi:hypothetical protein WDW86_04135 [Bdellovibrionota bacterium FG-2]
MTRILSAHKSWLGVFGIWMLLLSGALSRAVGSPGVLDWVRLDSLLLEKENQIALVEADIERLKAEAHLLETSAALQQREIRRVLGYAGKDELIFDFTANP